MQATPPSSPVESGDAEVRRLDLQGPFHTRSPWSVCGHETHWDPHRYAIDVYKMGEGGGDLDVLRYVTASKYPAERQSEGYVIDHEMPRLKQLLTKTYPKGVLF